MGWRDGELPWYLGSSLQKKQVRAEPKGSLGLPESLSGPQGWRWGGSLQKPT